MEFSVGYMAGVLVTAALVSVAYLIGRDPVPMAIGSSIGGIAFFLITLARR